MRDKVDFDLLQDLFNDTTEGTWVSKNGWLLIPLLTKGYDKYNLQSKPDAEFIAYAHNHMQEIINIVNKFADIYMLENADTTAEIIVDEASLEQLLEELEKQENEGCDDENMGSRI